MRKSALFGPSISLLQASGVLFAAWLLAPGFVLAQQATSKAKAPQKTPEAKNTKYNQPPAKSAPTQKKVTVTPKTQPAAKPAPAAAPKAVSKNSLDVPYEPGPVPATGPIGLEDLIASALYHNPDVLRRRGELDVARIAKEAAKDWEDPELRIGYSRETDIDVGDAYTERGVSRGNFSGSSSSFDSEYGAGGVYRHDAERMNFRESRYREFERRVTPGATRDRIEVTEYETRRESASGSRFRRERERNGDGILKDEERSSRGLRERSSRKIVGRTVTYEDHDDVTQGDDAWSFLIRWQLPNPWEQKAKVAVAEAEILQADWVLKQTVEETILAVRELYDELVEAELKQKNAAATAKYRYGTTATAAIDGKMAKAAEGASTAQLESLEMRLKARQIRSEIVALTGVKDLSRIVVPNTIQKRSISLSGLDSAYLKEMASIHRADYNIIRAKKAAAQAKVDEENSKKIPWAAFADVGMTHENSARGRDTTEWQFRLGVTLPIFSLFKNKAADVAREESRAFSRQEGASFERIQAEVDAALENLKDAEATMKAAAEEVQQARIFLQQAQGAAMISDKPLAAQNDAKEFEMGLQNALQPFTIEYNKAVLALEKALGTRIENIFIRE